MQQVGGLDERLIYNLDYEYWIRMALAGMQFKRLEAVMAYFRLSPSSKTVGQTAAMAVEQFRTLEELLAQPDLASRLGLTESQAHERARLARARIALRAAYGYARLRQWKQMWGWLGVALRNDPFAPFERRYLDLALASLQRRLRRIR